MIVKGNEEYEKIVEYNTNSTQLPTQSPLPAPSKRNPIMTLFITSIIIIHLYFYFYTVSLIRGCFDDMATRFKLIMISLFPPFTYMILFYMLVAGCEKTSKTSKSCKPKIIFLGNKGIL
jgi:hypothetical protein